MTETIALHGAAASLFLDVRADGPPLWRYWGPRLRDLALATKPKLPGFVLDAPVPFDLFPTFGMGWFGQSALLASREGRNFAQAMTETQVGWIEPGKSVEIVLTDSIAQVEAVVALALDADDVLTVSTRLTNRGDAAIDVQWLAAVVLPLPDDAEAVTSFAGRHNNEFVEDRQPLSRTLWRRENRRGLTSHDCFPGAVVTLPGTTQHSGVAYGAQLAWSGNHAQTIELLDDGRRQWQLGEWLAPGEVRLAPGDTLQSPEVLATCSIQGTGGVATNFHRAIRNRITWPGGAMTPRKVHLNSWEGYWFDHDEARMMRLADEAAAVGIERFILDDGWFKGRDNDGSSLGDWMPDARKYPRGLKPLADHVIERGMEFGLWVEPEMVNPDSDLYRAHPDWVLQVDGRPRPTARNQLALDLACEGVADHLFEQIAMLLREVPIGYLKWDHNRDLAPAGGADGRASYRAQVEALYALLGRLRAAFPAVEIEACAGGGGRIDAGIARHTHRFWTSDCTDALARLPIQRGFLQFMPPELMGAHIGAVPCHSTGRGQSLDFRAAVALTGHLGVELDLIKLDATERARLTEWTGFYKDWRHLLHRDCWQGEAGDGRLWHAAGTPDEWLLIVYRPAPMTMRFPAPVRLPFVDGEARYTIARIAPGWTGKAAALDGDELARLGLPVRDDLAETARIFHGKRID